jgi:ketosteroid isomerase-like protein
MFRWVVVLTWFWMGLACPCSSVAADDGAEIMQLERDRSRKFGERDVDWIVGIHLPDARQFPPNAPPVVGTEAIRAAWQSMADTDGLKLEWEPTNVTVSSGGDMAYDYGRGTLTNPDGKASPVRSVVIWERHDGTWKVAVDMFSPNE